MRIGAVLLEPCLKFHLRRQILRMSGNLYAKRVMFRAKGYNVSAVVSEARRQALVDYMVSTGIVLVVYAHRGTDLAGLPLVIQLNLFVGLVPPEG